MGRDGVAALMLAAGLFAIYAAGASPTIYVGDSGELVTAVHLLGIPHPTGYPLYVLLGKLWTLLVPFGSIAWRMSLFSAACAAAASAALFLLARREARLDPLPALTAAMNAGYTEPDPRDDLSGTDVARKALILGRLMGFKGEPASVVTESLVPDGAKALTLKAFLAKCKRQHSVAFQPECRLQVFSGQLNIIISEVVRSVGIVFSSCHLQWLIIAGHIYGTSKHQVFK